MARSKEELDKIISGDAWSEELNQQHPNGIPPAFNQRLLPKYTRHQVVFFDETHIEQEEEFITTTGYQIHFPHDENGKYSPPSVSNPWPIFAELEKKPLFKYAG